MGVWKNSYDGSIGRGIADAQARAIADRAEQEHGNPLEVELRRRIELVLTERAADSPRAQADAVVELLLEKGTPWPTTT